MDRTESPVPKKVGSGGKTPGRFTRLKWSGRAWLVRCAVFFRFCRRTASRLILLLLILLYATFWFCTRESFLLARFQEGFAQGGYNFSAARASFSLTSGILFEQIRLEPQEAMRDKIKIISLEAPSLIVQPDYLRFLLGDIGIDTASIQQPRIQARWAPKARWWIPPPVQDETHLDPYPFMKELHVFGGEVLYGDTRSFAPEYLHQFNHLCMDLSTSPREGVLSFRMQDAFLGKMSGTIKFRNTPGSAPTDYQIFVEAPEAELAEENKELLGLCLRPAARSFLKEWSPGGKFRFVVQDDLENETELTIESLDGRMRYAKMPYLLSGIRGKFRIRGDAFSTENLRLEPRGDLPEIKALISGGPELINISLKIRNLFLNRRLEAAISSTSAAKLHPLNLSGLLDLDCNRCWEQSPIGWVESGNLAGTLRDGRLLLPVVQVPVRNLEATFSQDSGTGDFQLEQALADAQGSLLFIERMNSKDEKLELVANVEPFLLTDNLMAPLPETLRKNLYRGELSGRVGLDHFQVQLEQGDQMRLAGTIRIPRLEYASEYLGRTLAWEAGRIDLGRVEKKGETLTVEGSARFDKISISTLPLLDNRFLFSWDAGRGRLFLDKSTLAKGNITAAFTLEPDHHFSGHLEMQNTDLHELTQQLFPPGKDAAVDQEVQKLEGKLGISLDIQRLPYDQGKGPFATGTLSVREGRIHEFSRFFSFLAAAISMRSPIRLSPYTLIELPPTIFTEATGRFSLFEEGVRIETLLFESPQYRITFFGSISYQGKLDLYFSVLNRSDFIGLREFYATRDWFVRQAALYHVTGQYDKPSVKLVPTAFVPKSWWNRMEPKPSATPEVQTPTKEVSP